MSTQQADARADLKDRVITITGGASGIGRAAARLFASRDARVVIADLDDEKGNALAREIRDAGGEAAFLRTDVAREDDIRAMIEFVKSSFGRLHAAFNNAGADTGLGPISEFPLDRWQRGMDVNLTSVFLCVKHQVEHMLEHGGGAILNTSSVSGAVGFPMQVDYVAAKHGVIGITRAAAAEVSGRGIRVNAIIPGATETPLLESAVRSHPGVRQMIEARHPIGRLGRPEEIAEAAAWLLSDAASFVTGACVAVDGGYTMQ